MKKIALFIVLAAIVLTNGGCSKETIVVLPKPDFADLLVKASPLKGIRQEQGAQDNTEVTVEILPESKTSVVFKEGNLQFSVAITYTDYQTAFLQISQQVSSAGNVIGRDLPKELIDVNDPKQLNNHGIFFANDGKGNTKNEVLLYVNVGNKVLTYNLRK
jgi:hypothetical protein